MSGYGQRHFPMAKFLVKGHTNGSIRTMHTFQTCVSPLYSWQRQTSKVNPG